MKSIDAKQTSELLTKFIRNTVKTSGHSRVVIAVSGGVDSATSLCLAVRALGKEHVFPLFLPYGTLNNQGVIDATEATTLLGIPKQQIQTIDIQPFVDSIVGYDTSITPIRKGNIMARVRMIVVFDQAKKQSALVVGTENKTEHYLGYFTRFGDEASDIEPLRNIYKTQVYQLAKELAVPQSILLKAPTAGLWEGQTDEKEFGFTYKEADEILSLYIDEKMTKEAMIAAGNKKEVIEEVLAYVEKNAFKQKMPYTIPEV